MKFSIKVMAILGFGFFTGQTKAMAADGPSLVGVFSGSLHLIDGTPRDIPFELSMNLSEEFEVVDTVSGPEQRRIIDAAFIIDNEGGPYNFARVSYDLDLNVLDLRYSRNLSDAIPGSRAPSNFRMTGKLNEDGSIEGRVISGLYGNIGSFKLAKSSVTFLQPSVKYFGSWTALPKWTDQTFWVNLEPTLTSTRNPPNLELDYTPGKVGGIDVGGGAQVGFNQITIDYIRQTVVLASIDALGPNLSLDCRIIRPALDLDCQFDSVYGGRKGPVYLRKVK